MFLSIILLIVAAFLITWAVAISNVMMSRDDLSLIERIVIWTMEIGLICVGLWLVIRFV